MNTRISLSELETAINYWRTRQPSLGEESRLCPQAAALAVPYAQMIMQHQQDIQTTDLTPEAQAACQAWRAEQSAKGMSH